VFREIVGIGGQNCSDLFLHAWSQALLGNKSDCLVTVVAPSKYLLRRCSNL
jgi:hypothetical protein